MIEPFLRLRLMTEGYNTEFQYGGFNAYAQEILDRSSALYGFSPDVVLILVRIEELLPDLNRNFGAHPFPHWEAKVREAARRMIELVEALEKNHPALVLLQNMSPPVPPFWGAYDSQQPESENFLVHTLNRLLAQGLQNRKSAFLWDFDAFMKRLGREAVLDSRMWYISRNPFRQSVVARIAEDLHRYILSALGRVKKCIVLDLDNTLWGGIAGEDGFDGVALGFDYPGNCYRDFQERLLRLYHRGILLAINSKNNEKDALEIIDKHPYMVLRRHHFAAMRINWNDKVSNLKELREELNIGLESMIFMDDSPVECEMVHRHCPECEVVRLPEKPYLIPDVVHSLSGIENLRITDEDRRKGEMYREQVARKKFEKSFANIGEFLASLDIEIDIEAASDFTVPRISQLTQKTNQMNMTTRRYTEADIRALVTAPDSHVFSVACRDRFGDNGIIGVIVAKFRGEESIIDSFLLSCRVIGREIERAMLAFLLSFSRERGMKALIGEYIPTPKNSPAAEVYPKCGFRREEGNFFRYDITDKSLESPSFIRTRIKI